MVITEDSSLRFTGGGINRIIDRNISRILGRVDRIDTRVLGFCWGRIDRINRIDWVNRINRIDGVNRIDRIDRIDGVNRINRIDGVNWVNRIDRINRIDWVNRIDRIDGVDWVYWSVLATTGISQIAWPPLVSISALGTMSITGPGGIVRDSLAFIATRCAWHCRSRFCRIDRVNRFNRINWIDRVNRLNDGVSTALTKISSVTRPPGLATGTRSTMGILCVVGIIGLSHTSTAVTILADDTSCSVL
jgi:hypothetical protein